MDIAKEIDAAYGIKGKLIPFGDGLINDTYKCGDYIVQKINTGVFGRPDLLIYNMLAVTEHIKARLKAEGKDPEKGTLTVVRTLSGEPLAEFPDGSVFRVTKNLENTVSYNAVTPGLLYKAAYGFGNFQAMLSDFDGSRLYETIKDFHNTPARYAALKNAVNEDKCGRVKEISKELSFVESIAPKLSAITDKLESGEIPTRVTHNDTKINNVLFDKDTGDFVAVIDLDTVMPGSLLYDYGDAVRFAANFAAEDEKDLSKVRINYDNFKAFTRGFLDAMGNSITETEKEMLPLSVEIIAAELGIRFLTDYLNGDVYFKVSRPGHNLDRARCQFRLAEVIDNEIPELLKIVYKED